MAARLSLDEWLAHYGESHQSPVNKKLHWLCVPVIAATVLALALKISVWAVLALCVLALVFYIRLSLRLALGMALFMILVVLGVWRLPLTALHYVGLFVLAWIGQFYGHRVEGKKPSFFQDLKFLLIGPAWVVDSLQRRGKSPTARSRSAS